MARASGGGRARVNTGRDVRGAERTRYGAEQKADVEEVVWLDLAGAGRGAEKVAATAALVRRTWLQGAWRRGEHRKKGSGRRGIDHRGRKKRSVRREADVRVMCGVVGGWWGAAVSFPFTRGAEGKGGLTEGWQTHGE
jgi:hypothetical protein